MALINCRECNKEITSKLNKCIHCGIGTPNGKKHGANKKILKILGVIFGLLILIGVFSGVEEEIKKQEKLANMTPAQLSEHNRIKKKQEQDSKGQDAHVACRAFMRQGMDGDIKLAPVMEYRYEYSLDKDQYYAYSWLKGQNAYGVWLKKNYKCTIEWDAAEQDWRFVDMKFLD